MATKKKSSKKNKNTKPAKAEAEAVEAVDEAPAAEEQAEQEPEAEAEAEAEAEPEPEPEPEPEAPEPEPAPEAKASKFLEGVTALRDYLKASGTGENKLCHLDSIEPCKGGAKKGVEAGIEALQDAGCGIGTLSKAQDYLASL